jgi:hypothetical protein
MECYCYLLLYASVHYYSLENENSCYSVKTWVRLSLLPTQAKNVEKFVQEEENTV